MYTHPLYEANDSRDLSEELFQSHLDSNDADTTTYDIVYSKFQGDGWSYTHHQDDFVKFKPRPTLDSPVADGVRPLGIFPHGALASRV
jgi:hypothetical protein